MEGLLYLRRLHHLQRHLGRQYQRLRNLRICCRVRAWHIAGRSRKGAKGVENGDSKKSGEIFKNQLRAH